MPRPKLSTRTNPDDAALTWRKWRADKWLSDPPLRLCSLAARGLWIDMLSFMMISPRPGYLVDASGRGIPASDLARLVGEPVENVEKLLNELKERRVFSVDRYGKIYSRRIVREQKSHEMGKKYAKKRWRNERQAKDLAENPMGDPHQNPIRRDRDRDRYISGNGQDDLFGSQPGRAKSKPKRQWTLDEKRQFAWDKVAAALGGTAEAWDTVTAAANGNGKAKAICKATAKKIGVIWYDGMPNLPTPEN